MDQEKCPRCSTGVYQLVASDDDNHVDTFRCFNCDYQETRAQRGFTIDDETRKVVPDPSQQDQTTGDGDSQVTPSEQDQGQVNQ